MKRIIKRLTADMSAVAVVAGLLLSYPLLFVAALLASPWMFLVVAITGYLAEIYAVRVAQPLLELLSKLHLGITPRFLMRDAAVLLLFARTIGAKESFEFALLAAGTFLLYGLRAAHTGLAVFMNRRRAMPVVTRNVDLSALKIADAPPRVLAEAHVTYFLYLDAFPVFGAVLGAISGAAIFGPLGALAGLAVGLSAVLGLLPHSRAAAPLGNRERVLKVVEDQINAYNPEVALYFSGSSDSAYQVNMWISTLERLDHKAVIILRERGILRQLGRTSLPVLCFPGATDLMNFGPLSKVRVALYASNVGKNIHMLRTVGMKHVFIGHGDSDKEASFNPFTKVYDEVWVAGAAGRERYRRAQVGVRDESIVEVGRPQLAEIVRSGPDIPRRSVLYAPTWEGWTEDLYHTSITDMGPKLIKRLLEHSPKIRVLYKPHPLTGTRDRKAMEAHEKIVALINSANRAQSGEPAGMPAGEANKRATAAANLPKLARKMANLSQITAGTGDDAQRARDTGRPHRGQDLEYQQVEAERKQAYWQSEDSSRHRVITGPMPHLYDCFNESDLLVSDISSVVADYIASGKPYSVTNMAKLPDADFRYKYPTADAAYLLTPDLADLNTILQAMEKEGGDSLADQRKSLKTHLLGPDEPDAMTRFNDAVNDLVRRSAATWVSPAEKDLGLEMARDHAEED
ncbi:hypothetical protein [Rhizohabitans arisaemae]|uniref:hypothetical protein n=1 Tax=Rhizohabitans arisaemae TaxID=2720610 RepID=UPI0024B25EA3|nr:hypothetical protein [Rhizohabitans arisaemae]